MRLPILIVVTSLPLAAAWYQLSGGAEFEPGEVGVAPFAPRDRSETVAVPAQGGASFAAGASVTGPSVFGPGSAGLQGADARTQSGADTAVPRPARAADLPQIVVSEPGSGQPPVPLAARDTAPEVGNRRVAESRTVLREGPGLRFDRVTELLQGERVSVLSEDPRGWVELRAAGNVSGWVQADALLPDD